MQTFFADSQGRPFPRRQSFNSPLRDGLHKIVPLLLRSCHHQGIREHCAGLAPEDDEKDSPIRLGLGSY